MLSAVIPGLVQTSVNYSNWRASAVCSGADGNTSWCAFTSNDGVLFAASEKHKGVYMTQLCTSVQLKLAW